MEAVAIEQAAGAWFEGVMFHQFFEVYRQNLEGWGHFEDTVEGAVLGARNFDASGFESAGDAFRLESHACGGGVVAFGIFDGRKFLFTVDFEQRDGLGERQRVEDETFKFNRVWGLGEDLFAGRQVDIGDGFSGAV